MSVFNHICGDIFQLYKFIKIDDSGIDSIYEEIPIEIEGKINKIGTQQNIVKGEMEEVIEILFPSDANVASLDRLETLGTLYEVYHLNPMHELKIVKAVKISEAESTD